MSLQNYIIEPEDRECIMCYYNVNNTKFSNQKYIFNQQCNCFYNIHYICLYDWIEKNNRCILCNEQFIITFNNTYDNFKSNNRLKLKLKPKYNCCNIL